MLKYYHAKLLSRQSHLIQQLNGQNADDFTNVYRVLISYVASVASVASFYLLDFGLHLILLGYESVHLHSSTET